MNTRRDALKTASLIAAIAPAAAGQQHRHTSEPKQGAAKPAAGYKPVFFSTGEFATLSTLVDLIIPRTGTPGASDAGVHMLIDKTAARNAAVGKQWRGGLRWLESTAAGFGDLDAAKQAGVLRGAANSPAGSEGAQFFQLLKDSTVDAYYSTREGLSVELGWNANTFLSEFKGCTHPEHQG